MLSREYRLPDDVDHWKVKRNVIGIISLIIGGFLSYVVLLVYMLNAQDLNGSVLVLFFGISFGVRFGIRMLNRNLDRVIQSNQMSGTVNNSTNDLR